jgi:hypothetical protein
MAAERCSARTAEGGCPHVILGILDIVAIIVVVVPVVVTLKIPTHAA